MSKQTPGPWKVFKDDFGFCIRPWNGGGDIRSIAEIRKYAPGGGTAEGNARLIAAAPDLLFALKNLLKVHECEGGTTYHAGDIAREAIAKAIGETK